MSLSTRVGNLAIRTKIIVSFMVILGLLVGLGGTALQRFSAMNATVEDLVTNSMSGMRYLGEMRGTFEAYRGDLMHALVVGDDKAALQNVQSELTELLQTYKDSEAKYAVTADPGTETVLYANITKYWNSFVDASSHIRELLTASKIADAKDYSASNLTPIVTALQAAFRADMAYNVASTVTSAADVSTSYATGQMYIIGFVVLALIVAIMAVVFLVRSISAPIRRSCSG